jgi:hypothetical protein
VRRSYDETNPRYFEVRPMSASSLQPFGPEIWLAAGPEAGVIGFQYPTRMAVIRLVGGGLFIWSPIALSESLRRELGELGEVRHLVAPNSLHHLFLGAWKAAYPHARLYAAPGLRLRRKDLDFDADLGDAPPPEWASDLDQVVMQGNRITTEVVFFHRRSGTALFTDLIQQFPPGWFRGWRAIAARLDLMTESEPSVPRKFHLAFVDRRAARAALRRVLSWPSSKVLMAHGAPVEEDGQAFVARAFRWLTG